MDLQPGETVLIETLANIRRKFEYAGGRVRVTDQRVLLEPHAVNFDSRPAEVALADITTVEPFNQFFFIPTGVRLTLQDGSQQHFITWSRKAVIDAIGRARARA
jgi:hypothetical protein